MSATASASPARRLDIAWVAFAALNVYAMTRFPHAPTIPFHFIWISLTLVYGLRTWGTSSMLLVLGAVCVTTSFVLADLIARGDIDWEEITEVPLMAVVFLAMVWHAQRRQAMNVELQQVAASERALREREQVFARQASHELRSPLSLARGHAQLVQRSLSPGTEAEDIAVVVEQLDRMTAITRHLLTLGSIERIETLRRTPIAVDEMVLAEMVRWAKTSSREWVFPSHGRIMASVDPDRFAAALDELLDNAVAHTEEGDRVEIVIEVHGDDLHVLVSDTGPGVPAVWAENVFETFWRGPKRRYHGSGLGLSIVKAVTAVHGGTASVVDTPGRGATFRMTFPGAVCSSATVVAGSLHS